MTSHLQENIPPGKWIKGSVAELHPGQDGFVRVVTLKTHSKYVTNQRRMEAFNLNYKKSLLGTW